MKFQFLCTLFLVLCITLSTSAKPVKRGLLGNTLKGVTNTVKKLLFHGKGTFFDPPSEGGAQGACGPYADKDSQIVAMNGDQYGDMSKKSHWCGKRVKICYKSKCTVATVTDACPTCDHGCLDLTPAVWGQLEENTSIGVLPISWGEYDGDDEGGDDEDSNEDDEST